MCGICGHSGQGDPQVLDRMLQALVHRGPDEDGRFRDRGVSLGIRRLRVIDPEGGRQPVTNETGRIVAVMNGEIYNYRELREDLQQKGHRFASRSDTEVLVHLYEEEGEEGVRRLQGMFAFALWDRERDRLLVVRDRLGIKPLYYAAIHDAAGDTQLAFASELPALLEAIPAPAVRPQALVDYFRYLYVPGPETIYEGVYELKPGEQLRLEQGRFHVERYWSPQSAHPRQRLKDKAGAVEALHGLLRDTVRAHMVSDVPLGLFLSGGLDSATLLAFMRQVAGDRIKTFSIGYDHPADQSYNELDRARSLARHFESDHVEARLSPDVAALLPSVVRGMAEPFADSCAIPTYLISQLARNSVTVALSGIGGDELFGGYPRYLGIRSSAWYAAVPRPIRSWIGHRVAPCIPEGTGGRDPWGRVRRFLVDGAHSQAKQYVRWMTFLPREWERRAFDEDWYAASDIGDTQAERELRFERWVSSDPADRASGFDLQTYLPDDLLRMGDRMSMRHSLELRVPYCDHQLLRFAQAIPSDMKYSGWRLKGFFREAVRALLPPEISEGPKYGFRIPLARWLREDIRPMVRDLLNEATIRERGYLNPAYVRWVLDEHDSGRRNFADQIYALLVMELWERERRSASVGTR
ncbi:MAG: asparagine synthase (glutamine-hydrolyzing) [Nitrospiraceae bacterium]|nr:asparagine synthase (glutamine-hydrolyzing) [Nitrospiraceae bacterium]